MRAVSVLEVCETGVWDEIAAVFPLANHVETHLDDLRAVMRPSFDRALADLEGCGVRVLVRYAHRDAAQEASDRARLDGVTSKLSAHASGVLAEAQRHALDGVVMGRHAWDPEHDAPAVWELHGAGLLMSVDAEAPPYEGRYRLHPDLRPAQQIDYDFSEAVMGRTDDLGEPGPGAVSLLHDLASLAAALMRVTCRRTHAGALTKADARGLGRQLGDPNLAKSGNFDEFPRWSRALTALELLKAVDTDPLSREIFVDLGLEATLAGDAVQAVDRFVHRLVDHDLHVLLPAIRAALRQAGSGAVDAMVFAEELFDQHRDVVFPVWRRAGVRVYPAATDQPDHAYDDDGWEAFEVHMIRATLSRMRRMGLIVQAPGMFAASEDGRMWAEGADRPTPPVWVSSDMEITVPPESVTPWERFQLERLSRCLGRDVVDRYQLERAGLASWLKTHDVSEALDLLARRSPGVPLVVRSTMEQWARSAQRIVLTRGVMLEDAGA